MNDNHDRIWLEIARRVQAGQRHIATGKEADDLLTQLPDTQLDQDDLTAIAQAVAAGRALGDFRYPPAQHGTVEEEFASPGELEAIEEDVLQLNRNKRDSDDSARDLVDRLRREALEDDEDEEK